MTLKYVLPEQLITKDLAEFIGIVLGDGGVYRFPRTGKIYVTGHREQDFEYYQNHVTQLCQRQFNITPSVRQYSTRALLAIYSQELFELLTKRFSIPIGPKAHSAKIPDEIMHSTAQVRYACVRGLFDTDGGVGIDRRTTYRIPYLRVNFVTSSEALICQVNSILVEANIPHSIHTRHYGIQFQIQINGPDNVRKFVETIGFANPRHTTKLAAFMRNEDKPTELKRVHENPLAARAKSLEGSCNGSAVHERASS